MNEEPFVCVYAICKNEENNIERWYDSVKDADYVFIVDTGSTDGTMNYLVNMWKRSPFTNVSFSTYDNGTEKYLNFGKARTYAYTTVREELKKRSGVNIDNVVFVSLDLDEFLEKDGIKKIKKYWNNEYDTMTMIGETKGSEPQIVYHKIHSSNKDWVWKRRVHEIISLPNKFQRDWKINNVDIRYTHEQDIRKERNYLPMLEIDHEENPKDIKTCMYLAWEYYNHGLLEDYFKFSKLSNELIVSSSNDEFYLDYEYLIQTYLNMANYSITKENYIDANNYYNEIIETIFNTHKFPEIRIVYVKYAEVLWKLSDYYLSVGDINRCIDFKNYTISTYYKILSIKDKPECWVDDQFYYDDNLIYSLISTAYYYMAEICTDDTSKRNNFYNAVTTAEIAHYSDVQNVQYKSNLDLCVKAFEDNIVNGSFNKPEEYVYETNKICVYAISKNEEQFVDKWYESMKEADSIVVLDTGSTDSTVSKLRSHGVTVVEKLINPWRFDTARNEALKLAPMDCNILVSTDLDEVLEPGWADILRERWVEGQHERAVYKYSWSHLENGESGRIFQYDKVHSRNWKWRYPVHELLWNDKTNTNLYDEENVLYLFDEMHLHHYPDVTKSRSSYLPLLELRAKENENDYYGLIYLAHEYFYQSMYEKSIVTLGKVLLKFGNQCNPVEKASCYLFMGDCYTEIKKPIKAMDSYLKAIAIDESYREPYMNLGKLLLSENKYEIAIAYIKLGLKKSYRHYTWVERDLSWTYEPYDLLSLAYFYSGNKKESLVYAVKALSYNPENERLKNNVTSILDATSDEELI